MESDIIKTKGVDSMNSHCILLYFHKYSDFCFQIENDFIVRVSEDQSGETVVFVEHSGISFKAVVFEQDALSVFREMSPTDWICGSSGYLKQLYQQRSCVICQNMSNFKKIQKKVLT